MRTREIENHFVPTLIFEGRLGEEKGEEGERGGVKTKKLEQEDFKWYMLLMNCCFKNSVLGRMRHGLPCQNATIMVFRVKMRQ